MHPAPGSAALFLGLLGLIGLIGPAGLAGCVTGGGGGPDSAPIIDGDGLPTDDAAPADVSPTPPDGSTDAATDGGPEGVPPDGGPPDGCADCGAAPRIITFAANVTRLTAGEQVILTAVVTDPDGAADLLGGVLETPDGTPYGPFVAAGEVGTYSFTLSWDALNAVQPIEFDGEGRRAVAAAFFDQAGNRTAEALELTLRCAEGAACAGVCVSLDTPAHCGACGAACDAVCRDRACVCDDGLTRCEGACIETVDDPTNCGGCGVSCDAPPDGEGLCRDGRCQVRCDPGFLQCAPGACAPCPVEGVARASCDGGRCVAAACEDDHRMCDGACAVCPGPEAQGELCYGGRCVAPLCGLDTHPCAEGCCPWRSLDAGAAGQTFALAHDGEVHIAVGDHERVVYRRWIDGDWVDETPLVLDTPALSAIDVRVARVDGVTHLVYGVMWPPRGDGSVPSRIGYLRREGGAWRAVGAVDGGDELYRAPDLAVRGDAVRVAWAGRRIRVVDPREVPWAPALAFEGSESDPRLTIGPDGVVHLVAVELFGDMVYARQAPGGAFEAVDHGAGPLGGYAPTVGTDADGRAVLLHRTEGDGQLYATRFDGARWRTEAVLPGFQALFGHDLFNGPDGRVVACLGTQVGLHLMYETDRGMTAREVANGDHYGCTFALAPDGGQHVMSVAGATVYWFY